ASPMRGGRSWPITAPCRTRPKRPSPESLRPCGRCGPTCPAEHKSCPRKTCVQSAICPLKHIEDFMRLPLIVSALFIALPAYAQDAQIAVAANFTAAAEEL